MNIKDPVFSYEDMINAFEAGENNRESVTKYQKQGQDEWLMNYMKKSHLTIDDLDHSTFPLLP